MFRSFGVRLLLEPRRQRERRMYFDCYTVVFNVSCRKAVVNDDDVDPDQDYEDEYDEEGYLNDKDRDEYVSFCTQKPLR